MRPAGDPTEPGRHGDSEPLGGQTRGFRGRVTGLDAHQNRSLAPGELERRLVELGIIDGAVVEIMHEGLFGRDPIALRVDSTTVAIRRREAMAILVRPE